MRTLQITTAFPGCLWHGPLVSAGNGPPKPRYGMSATEPPSYVFFVSTTGYALGRRTLCVRDLAIVTGVSESAMSHQLRLLRDRRVVKARRDGTTMYYSVDDQHVAALLREAEYHADHVRQGLPDHVPYRPAEG